MRPISKIIWHCTATPATLNVTKDMLRRWHVDERGWSDIGYHFLIMLDGTIVECRPIDRVGAHCRGQNTGSIGIAYAGGVDGAGKPKDTRTGAQRRALYELTESLIATYNIPEDAIHGHNEFAAKACPSFDAAQDWARHKSSSTGQDRMPEAGAMGAIIAEQQARIEALENWIMSFKGA